MTDQKTASEPIRLNFRSETRVVVEPEDNDRFVMTVKEAAQACKKAVDDKNFQDDFRQFLIHLEQWGESQAAKISAIYVNIGDGVLNVLVCTPSQAYDVDLDDTISDLDLELVDRFPWVVAEVMQVPASQCGDRSPFEKTIVVYGDGKRPPVEGGA